MDGCYYLNSILNLNDDKIKCEFCENLQHTSENNRPKDRKWKNPDPSCEKPHVCPYDYLEHSMAHKVTT
jgi:hypothetical protein